MVAPGGIKGDSLSRVIPHVAILGRPNVGKSTLANHIAGGKKFLARGEPGVTRDRNYVLVTRYEKPFYLIDIGGFVPEEKESLLREVRRQAEMALAEADLIIFLTDGKAGPHPYDAELATILRKCQKPIFVAVNKIDSLKDESLAAEFYQLGFDRLFPISAEHGLGVKHLLDELLESIPQRVLEEEQERIRVAVVGRPNVGKSCLINRILGYDRVIVSELPGTTRDPVDTPFDLEGDSYLLVDTAGIRRKARILQDLEKATVSRALRSIDRCHLAMVVLDALEAFTDQDLRLIDYALKKGRAVLIVVNKWDLVLKAGVSSRQYLAQLKDRLSPLGKFPLVTVSALTGLRVMPSLRLAGRIYRQYMSRIPTHQLNEGLVRWVGYYPPPAFGQKSVRLTYAVQTGTGPPSFIFFANHPEGIKESYRRYLINQIGQTFDLSSVPIGVIFRKKR